MPSSIILRFLGFQLLRVASAQENPGKFQLHLPNGSPLQPPTGMTLKFLALGSGTQNYICQKDPSGKTTSWAPHGAEATLYDISKDSSKADQLVTDLMAGSKDKRARPNLNSYPVLGKHTFKSEKGKLSPTFQIGSDTLILQKTQSTPSPLNSKRNVDWLQLDAVEGTLAKRVYRTTTRGGKVNAPKCPKVNEITKEPYAAIYSFWA
ncbi:hypothetical protein PCASD_02239 [Puccinia coronata f. sp. avenae]|uniref:Uncharacterized protein n=1 Tax=Puccinia coronata f. sp. avenae TaxID=200324 RepID=A0A2N5VHX3_9BASI|nr:hypothetical protein PCASD_02239 [Puccinia coronata f. sp. avenae]